MSSEPIHVVGAAIVDARSCLVTRRSQQMSAPGKWEFPGGKVEAGESPREALRREIREELGLEIEVGEFLATGWKETEEARIRLDVYLAEITGGTLHLHEHAEAEWIDPDDLGDRDWATPDWPAVHALERRFTLR